MTAWSDEELRRIGQAEELQLASLRADGTLRKYVTMWVVRAGDDLYVRSAYGWTIRGSGEQKQAASVASAPAAWNAT